MSGMGSARWKTLAAGLVAAFLLPIVPAPVASAAPCPDVELVFARGRNEAPGAGQIGEALVRALRTKTGKNIGLYAVKYPANTEVDLGAASRGSGLSAGADRQPPKWLADRLYVADGGANRIVWLEFNSR